MLLVDIILVPDTKVNNLATVNHKIPITILISAFISSLFLSPVFCQGLANQTLNGIYFDSDGRPEFPIIAESQDTAVRLFNSPGNWPTGLTRQGTLYWVADSHADSSRLYKLSQTGGVIPPPFEAPLYGYSGLEYDGTNLWAVYQLGFKIYKLDTSNGTKIDSLTLARPDTTAPDRHPWGLAWDGHNLWVSEYGDDGIIYKIDRTTGAVLDSITAPTNRLLGITWAEGYLCGVDIRTLRMYRLSPDTSAPVDSYPWPVNYPLGLYYQNGNFINASGSSEYGGDEGIYSVNIETGIDNQYVQPSVVDLFTAYPNPFNASTTIHYSLVKPSQVSVDIYNMLGQRVAVLDDGFHQAGEYAILWNPQELVSGIYFARIAGVDNNQSLKLILLK